MRIKVERSGGFAGMVTSHAMDIADLPPNLAANIKKIINDGYQYPKATIPRGAADHITYRIIIENGSKKSEINCNQYDIQENLKSVISFIEKNSK